MTSINISQKAPASGGAPVRGVSGATDTSSHRLAASGLEHLHFSQRPALSDLSVLAAVVTPRAAVLEQVQPQGRGWRRTLGREAVERLFELRDQGVSFGAIAMQFHVPKGTLVAISQKATRDGRRAVLERYRPAANGR